MEKQVVYGVFKVAIPLPEKVDRKKEIANIADAMTSLNGAYGRAIFVRAYKTLRRAVNDCYDENGALMQRIMETPEGVVNGKETYIYFPKEIEVEP